MNWKKINVLLTTLILLLFASILAFSQDVKEKALTDAIELFDMGSFEEAELILKQLIVESPDDFMVNYYYGACRTENKHFTTPDLEALIKANQEVSPMDINLYFGIQYHARSNWERALKFYNKYNSTANLSGNKKQNILEKIQQCYDKINPYEQYVNQAVEEKMAADSLFEITSQAAGSESEAILENANPENIELAATALIGADKSSNEIEIDFKVNNEITYLYLSHFKTEAGKVLFEQAEDKQLKFDYLLQAADSLRDEYAAVTRLEEKKLIGEKILVLENDSYTLKKEVSQLYYESKIQELEYWKNTNYDELSAFKSEISQISKHLGEIKTPSETSTIDSTVLINPNVLLGKNEIPPPVDETKEKDLVYKIQIGAYSKGLPGYIEKLYKKLSLIRKIDNYTDSRGVVVYTTGNLSNYEDAVKMQNQVRREGIEGAFVVPYFKGKRITLKEAKELEG